MSVHHGSHNLSNLSVLGTTNLSSTATSHRSDMRRIRRDMLRIAKLFNFLIPYASPYFLFTMLKSQNAR